MLALTETYSCTVLTASDGQTTSPPLRLPSHLDYLGPPPQVTRALLLDAEIILRRCRTVNTCVNTVLTPVLTPVSGQVLTRTNTYFCCVNTVPYSTFTVLNIKT